MKTFFIILFCFLISSCSSTKNTEYKNPVLSIETLRCMGDCPVFSLKIYKNGRILYEGKMFVPLTGRYSGKISKKKLQDLQEKFLENGFFDFQDSYRAPGMDMQTTFIYFSHEGKEKRIRDNSNPPAKLRELEDLLTSLIETVKWKAVK